MRRAAILFFVVLAACTYLWPWLREAGLVGLPGHVVTEIEGYRLHLPLGLSLLITGAIAGAWQMLEPP